AGGEGAAARTDLLRPPGGPAGSADRRGAAGRRLPRPWRPRLRLDAGRRAALPPPGRGRGGGPVRAALVREGLPGLERAPAPPRRRPGRRAPRSPIRAGLDRADAVEPRRPSLRPGTPRSARSLPDRDLTRRADSARAFSAGAVPPGHERRGRSLPSSLSSTLGKGTPILPRALVSWAWSGVRDRRTLRGGLAGVGVGVLVAAADRHRDRRADPRPDR